jgi:hypothetical protein
MEELRGVGGVLIKTPTRRRGAFGWPSESVRLSNLNEEKGGISHPSAF